MSFNPIRENKILAKISGFTVSRVDSIQLFHTYLCNSKNYYPRGVQPRATVHRVIHSTEGMIVLTVEGMKQLLYYPTHDNIKYQLCNADIDAHITMIRFH